MNNTQQPFDIKNKTLNYEMLLNEVVNADKHEVNAMFFAQYPYSIMNRVLACSQCHMQGFKFGLLQCGSKWAEQGRTKKANAKKLWLRLPISYKKYDKYTKQPILDENGNQEYGHGYKFANNWLVYEQTEGKELEQKELNAIMDIDKTCKNLLIQKIDFDLDGACGGYAIVSKRQLAVNPAWHDVKDVAKVLFHELAHIVLNHKPEQMTEQKELEAELTAMMIAKIYDLPCKEQASYIKTWIKEKYTMLNKDTYKRCLQACELIVKASKSDKPVIECKNGEYKPVKDKE